jgi:hypothetical protein
LRHELDAAPGVALLYCRFTAALQHALDAAPGVALLYCCFNADLLPIYCRFTAAFPPPCCRCACSCTGCIMRT